MSNKIKEKGKTKDSKPSTTDRLNQFINFSLTNLRTLDNNDQVFEQRINYILGKLAGDKTIEEDEIGDDVTFISQFYVEKEGTLYKIKFLIEGYQLVPAEVGETEGETKDPNKFKFKKEDIEVEITAPSIEEAVEELKTRIRASKNLAVV